MGNIYPLFVGLVTSSAIGMLVLGVLTWRKQNSAGASMLAGMLFATAIWAFANVLETLWLDLPGKLFWAHCKYFGIIPAPLFMLGFVLQYSRRGEWLQRKYILPALIIPLITLTAIWTDSFHHLFYSLASLRFIDGHAFLRTEHGPLFWLHAVYSYLILLAGVILLIHQALTSSWSFRLQSWMLLVAALVPWGANIYSLTSQNPYVVLDLTPVAFSITGLAVYLAIFSLRVLEISPIARRLVLENMQDGMLVLNLEDRILDLNPTVSTWLEKRPDEVIGLRLTDIFEPRAAKSLAECWESPTVMQVDTNFQNLVQTLEIHSSLIYDSKGRAVGRLLLMRDVTEQVRTNRSLSDALALNQQIISASALGIAAFDQEGNCVLANQVLAEVTRAPVNQILGKNYHALPTWERSGMRQAADQVMATQTTREDIFHIVGPTGRHLWLECYLTAFTSAGQPHLLLLTHDVTARKAAEDELRRSEMRFRTLVDSMNDMVFTLDEEGRHTAVFGRWLAQQGIDASFFLGRNALEVLGPEAGQLHMEANLKSLQGQAVVYDWESPAESGSRYYQTSLSPLTEDGQVTGIVGVGRDITELKTLEIELEEAKALLEQAFEQSQAPMVLLSCPEGVIELFNSACQTGLRMGDPAKLRGVPISKANLNWEVRDPDGSSLPRERWPLSVALHGGTIENAEYQLHFDDGSVSWVICNATPIRNKAGNQIAALLVFVDITERRQIESAEREQRILAEAFRDTAAILNSTIQLDTVLTLVLTNIERVVPNDAAHLVLFNEEGDPNRTRFRGYAADEQKLALELSMHAAGQPDLHNNLEQPQAVMIGDISAEPAWAGLDHFKRLRAFLNVPIRFKDRLVGVITLASAAPNFFAPVHAARLQVFADQAAIAIENARLYAEVQHLTLTDELTRVYNYRGLIELGQREFDRARRFNRPLTLFFFDIDHFRDFNNRYSHAVGNQVLQSVANVARNSLRLVDVVARFGGEEFVIMLPETDLESALQVAERLRQEVAENFTLTRYGKLNVTISIGVAEMTDDLSSLGGLIDRANQAEHRAKDNGRNRVSV